MSCRGIRKPCSPGWAGAVFCGSLGSQWGHQHPCSSAHCWKYYHGSNFTTYSATQPSGRNRYCDKRPSPKHVRPTVHTIIVVIIFSCGPKLKNRANFVFSSSRLSPCCRSRKGAFRNSTFTVQRQSPGLKTKNKSS